MKQIPLLKGRAVRGFTLIELLVVISIIAILATIIIVGLSVIRAKSRDVKRKSDLLDIKNAIVSYSLDHGDILPVGEGHIENTDTYWDFDTACGEFTGCSLYHTITIGGYLDKMPVDPNPSKAFGDYGYTGYLYYRADTNDIGLTIPEQDRSTRKGYIYAGLERPSVGDKITMTDILMDEYVAAVTCFPHADPNYRTFNYKLIIE